MNTFLKLTLPLTAVLCITAGCTVFHSRPISPTQTASALESRSLENPELKTYLEKNLHIDLKEWPLKLWTFEMLTLAAFYYHPDLDVARAKWGVAEAGIITAGAIPNPTLGSYIGFISNQASGVNPWLYGFSLDIPIETAGKRGYRLNRAKHLSTAAYFNVAVVAWKVRSRLRANLVNLYAAGHSETLLKKKETIQEEIVILMEKRLTAGEVSLPDVNQAHISLNQVRLSLREAQSRRAEALAQVAASLGVPVTAVEGINSSFEFMERRLSNLPSSDIRRQALLCRADILSALSEYDASQSALQLEISKQYPDIRLGPGYNFDDAQNKWTIGLSVTLPVFNRNQGPIAEARARRTEAAARFTALQAGIMGEIDRALSGYHSVLRTLETAETLLSNQRSRVQSARAMFDAGETDRLTFLSAQMELAASELARMDTFVKVQQSLGLLEDAMQRPLNHTVFSLPEIKPLTEER